MSGSTSPLAAAMMPPDPNAPVPPVPLASMLTALQRNPVGTQQDAFAGQSVGNQGTPGSFDALRGMPGGQPMMQSDLDAARAQIAQARDTAQMTALGMVGDAPGPKPTGGFTAYHGSPHDFAATPGNPLGEFSDAKINTGEGAQMFGYGHYLADREAVSKSYRDDLTQPNLPTPTSISGKPTYDLWNKYADPSGAITIDGVIWHGPRDFVRNLQQGRTTLEGAPPDLAAALQSHTNQGRMYEVHVNADPAHFLDWDKPLSEQPQIVQDKIAHLSNLGIAARSPDPNMTGGQIYQDMLHKAGNSQNVAAHLASPLPGSVPGDPSVAGIRYLDAGSRGAGEGSRNTVVFDPKLLEIMRKYGLAGLLAGGASTPYLPQLNGASSQPPLPPQGAPSP